MNRRGLFKLLGAALVLPFLPKPKIRVPWRGMTTTMRWDQCEISNLTYNGVPMTYQAKLADVRHRQMIKFYDAMEERRWQVPGDANDLST